MLSGTKRLIGPLLPLLTLLLLIQVGSARAVHALELSPTEAEWLARHPVIRLAPDPEFRPIEYFDPQGRYRGLASDYVALAEQRLGIRFQIQHLADWNCVLESTKEGDTDMWGGRHRDPAT